MQQYLYTSFDMCKMQNIWRRALQVIDHKNEMNERRDENEMLKKLPLSLLHKNAKKYALYGVLSCFKFECVV